ncbi:MAG: 30S ribosomal protein S5 [Candidatus Peregrinibacteria bacterium]
MAKKNLKKAGMQMEEQKEFDEEVLQIDRVTRVVKGGRRLRFRVTVAIGDRKGRVGIGIGKASEVVNGIKKAVARAKKSLIRVSIAEGDTIPHGVNIKYKSVHLMILPAAPGTGVIAGGSLRKVLSLAGVKNVLSKNFGSRNALVMAQTSIKALASLRPARKPAKLEQREQLGKKSESEAIKEKRQQEIAKKSKKTAAKTEKPKEVEVVKSDTPEIPQNPGTSEVPQGGASSQSEKAEDSVS